MTSLVTNGGRLEIIEAHIPLPPLLSAMTTFQNPNNYGWLQPSPLPTFPPQIFYTRMCIEIWKKRSATTSVFRLKLDF